MRVEKPRSGGDGAAADDAPAGEHHGGLAGGGAGNRLAEPKAELRVAPGGKIRLHARRHCSRVVAQPHRVDPGALTVEDGIAHLHRARIELLPGADRDRVADRVGAEHIERLPGGHAQAASLADCEVVLPAVAAERATPAVDHVAAAVAQTAVAAQELALAAAGEEAEVLALGLACNRQSM